MKSFISAMDGLSKVVKIILAIPFLDIIWGIYRLVRSIDNQNTLGIILAVLLLIIGIPFLWLIDIICIVLNDKVWWID